MDDEIGWLSTPEAESGGMSVLELNPEWRPIKTAPRNGLSIIVTAEGEGAYVMHWNPQGTNPLVQSGLGIWEDATRSFTWSEEQGCGPTHWAPLDSEPGPRPITEPFPFHNHRTLAEVWGLARNKEQAG